MFGVTSVAHGHLVEVVRNRISFDHLYKPVVIPWEYLLRMLAQITPLGPSTYQ